MNIQILIATTNNNHISCSNEQNLNFLIINQLLDKSLHQNDEKNIFSFYERGLSKSRNRAINKANSDICLISDDDLVYKEEIEKTILNAFNENIDADIITFQVETPEGKPYKNYKNSSFWHTTKTLMSVSSVEIAFRKSSILKSNLSFDENFGLGTSFPTGEEILFLTDALKKGLKILYIPKPIVVHPIESSGKDYDNTMLIKAKGAMFYRIFGFYGYFVSLLFAFKKNKLSKFGFLKFLSLMLSGISNYKGIINAK